MAWKETQQIVAAANAGNEAALREMVRIAEESPNMRGATFVALLATYDRLDLIVAERLTGAALYTLLRVAEQKGYPNFERTATQVLLTTHDWPLRARALSYLATSKPASENLNVWYEDLKMRLADFHPITPSNVPHESYAGGRAARSELRRVRKLVENRIQGSSGEDR